VNIIALCHDRPSDLPCLLHVLCSCLQQEPGHVFQMRATATDQGTEPKMSETDVELLVVESRKRAPSFTNPVDMIIHLKENFSDFSTPIATLTAM